MNDPFLTDHFFISCVNNINFVEVDMSTEKCVVCKAELNVPNGSNKILCETCDDIIDFETKRYNV